MSTFDALFPVPSGGRNADDMGLPPRGRVGATSGWIPVTERLPDCETPVLIWMSSASQPSGKPQIGELRWDHPGHEDTYIPYQYWDDPDDDGKSWEWHDITYWMPLPAAPTQEPDHAI